MKENFQLSCESTVDLPFSYVDGRNIKVLFYSYFVDGAEYADDMGRDPAALDRFYNFLNEGKIPTTSQINEFAYEEFFRSILDEGKDVFHICFGTGMTGSYYNAVKVADALKKEYPDRKIVVIDSLCSSSGYGMLVDDVKDMFDEGIESDKIIDWIEKNKNRIHHQFYSTDLKYYRRTGRMSGPVAGIAAIFRIHPIMRLNSKGKIIAYTKTIGKAAAIKKTLDTMEEHCDDGKNYSGKCWICHSNNLPDAILTKEKIQERFSNIKSEIKILDIGTIIASHSGPGTIAVFFHGDERKD